MKYAASALAILAAAASAVAEPLLGQLEQGLSCAQASLQLSCHATYDIPSTSPANCCFNGALTNNGTYANKQSGLILSTQFWTTNAADPANDGPADSTTIHGLWPDFCDGTYPHFCSSISGIPEYSGEEIVQVIQKYDPALYKYFQTYYKDLNGDAAGFMEHEYNKHGTCYTTMRNQCQPKLPWISQADFAVLNYFRQIAHKFQERPTVEFLKAAGITPSATQTYDLTKIQQALKNGHGATPFVGCNKNGEMNEFWFFWLVKGQINFGFFEPVESTTKSTCPQTVKWLPKPSAN